MSTKEGISGFQQFLMELRDSDGVHISPSRFAEALKLAQGELATLARVHHNTPRHFPHSLQLQKYLRDAVRVLSAASNFAEDDFLRAVYWFRNDPIQPLEYKTAEVLVSEGRTEQVLMYIDSLNAGTG